MDNEETIEELRAALAELESGEGLSRFVEGHGLQSRFFAFSWKSEGLSIDFNLPCGRGHRAREGAQGARLRRLHRRLGEARRPAQGRRPAAGAAPVLQGIQQGVHRIRQQRAEIRQSRRLSLPPRPPHRHRQARLVRTVAPRSRRGGLQSLFRRGAAGLVSFLL